ncbi:acyl-CoA dehydrogenase family protein [Actinomadura sp. SCN-SB]|uniref:acyl-CoA dehydrogenase family protein n=1 Tax=Actinomadura sp. SCN-SB TaxID=3373092 RepID=UPI003750EEA4
MTTDYAADLTAYRAAVREFVTSPVLDKWRGAATDDVADDMRSSAGLMRCLYDAGFGRYGMPPEVGGLGGDVRHWAVLFDELARAGLTPTGQHSLLTTLAYPVARFAPRLAAAYLPEFLSGDAWWGQGFSEPEAGSDLAALRCRATRDGDDYVISGSKIWTSHGATASRIVLLARTGTQESRHRGLSMILVDVDDPGVTVRPIALASGREELAECFFDDVRVPASRLIGAEGEGWAVAMYLLQYERAVYAWLRASALLQRVRVLTEAMADGGSGTGAADGILGGVYLDLVSLRARSVDTVRRLAAGQTVGPEASTDKLLLGACEQSVYDAARSLLGPAFMFGEAGRQWREEWWYSRTTTVYGGSAEVQRGIIADRVLKLPKE